MQSAYSTAKANWAKEITYTTRIQSVETEVLFTKRDINNYENIHFLKYT